MREGMSEKVFSRLPAAAAIVITALLLACMMPSKGTPVFVDVRAGDFWSGKGLLTEVSEDKRTCRVSVRDRALIVKDLWLDCQRIHRRNARN
jgi:hypothetical protein